MPCKAYQASDQMVCTHCVLSWDVNDPDPPRCRVVEQESLNGILAEMKARRGGEVNEDLAAFEHAMLLANDLPLFVQSVLKIRLYPWQKQALEAWVAQDRKTRQR